MKVPVRLITCGASVLFVAALGLQAQTTQIRTQSSSDSQTTPSGVTREKERERTSIKTTPSDAPQASSQADATAETRSRSPDIRSTPDAGTASGTSSASASGSASAAQSTTGTQSTRDTQTTTDAQPGAQPAAPGTTTRTESGAVIGTQADTQTTIQQGTTQSSVTTATQHDEQVTTVVRQINAQGPAVVQRITTHFADFACSEENARSLIEALRSGTPVTLTTKVNGQTQSTTFRPTTTNLGYGEVFMVLSLAEEVLRNAGVTTCATPEQWEAVLLGGPLAVAGTTTTATTGVATATAQTQFPGILTLRSQRQGWGQIAQASNVQLGEVVSSARQSLNIDVGADTTLSPTGRTPAEPTRSETTTGTVDTSAGASTDTATSTRVLPETDTSPRASSDPSIRAEDDRGKDKAKGKRKSGGARSVDDDGSQSSTPASSEARPNR